MHGQVPKSPSEVARVKMPTAPNHVQSFRPKTEGMNQQCYTTCTVVRLMLASSTMLAYACSPCSYLRQVELMAAYHGHSAQRVCWLPAVHLHARYSRHSAGCRASRAAAQVAQGFEMDSSTSILAITATRPRRHHLDHFNQAQGPLCVRKVMQDARATARKKHGCLDCADICSGNRFSSASPK